MESEWLAELPADIVEAWEAVVCPVGKRVLVLSSKVDFLLALLKGSLPCICSAVAYMLGALCVSN